MSQVPLVIALAVVYLAALFALAVYVDRAKPKWFAGQLRPVVYALGLGIYCTSWAFFGAVGYAAQAGWSYLALSLGPILLLTLFGSTLKRVARIAHETNISSIADFIGARYGKSERVASLVALIAITGSTFLIAIQLKAIDLATAALVGPRDDASIEPALVAALALGVFAMLFGGRKVAATERQDGLSVSIAVESVVKLAVAIAVAAFIVIAIGGGVSELFQRASLANAAPFAAAPEPGRWFALTLMSFSAFLVMPRVFHMAVVENRAEADVAVARWLTPAYFAIFALFAAPVALAGLAIFPAGGGGPSPSDFALALPIRAGAPAIALIAFLGALSAAAAMTIVESLAISVMASNDLAMPVMLRGRSARRADMTHRLLAARRAAIAAAILAAYGASRLIGPGGISVAPLVVVAAIAQLAPAFFGGLVWRRANARGAILGILAGLTVWAVTLLWPALTGGGGVMLATATAPSLPLIGDPLTFAVSASLGLNVMFFVLGSLSREATTIERQQAALFCGGEEAGSERPRAAALSAIGRSWRSRATAGELVRTVARYLGPDRAETAFRGFAIARGAALDPDGEIDLQTLRFTEHLLASAIGAASSRLVLSMLLTRRNVTPSDALQLLDHASAAMQTNRDVLQNALDHARQGVTAIDGEMKLVCWNRQFRELFDLPEEMIHFGVGLDDIFRFNAARGLYGPINAEEFIKDRIERFVVKLETLRTKLHPSGRVIEIRSARMPDGGVVTTYTDISDTVAAQEALERANETLERRVRERTRELTRLNQALARAKTEADEANISKTRFLAAASHDILQPLNAARLFATSLAERSNDNPDQSRLARNVESSLDGVEEILSTLLDISRLDTGAMRPEISTFRLSEITGQLAREFAPVAEEKGLKLVMIPTSVTIRSDRRLLRRVLQNLVSNALKYTPSGRVLVGCRRLKGRIRIEVWDTGLGIAEQQQKVVFREFKRLEQGAKVAPGLGLGLSIVERIARMLDHPITLRSRPGKGSIFAVDVPVAVAVPAIQAETAPSSPPNPALAGLVVLAIDNEPAILEGMTALLQGWGCEVIAAASQKDAEHEAVRRKVIPDVMLADYHLDDADGLEVITSLRWRFGRPIPSVLITADRSLQLRAEADEKRVMMLPKPIRPAALRALLSQARSMRTAAE